MTIANDERIAEMEPKPRKDLADRRLRRVEQLSGAREIALPQQDAQGPQVFQANVPGIPDWHERHSGSGIGPIRPER